MREAAEMMLVRPSQYPDSEGSNQTRRIAPPEGAQSLRG